MILLLKGLILISTIAATAGTVALIILIFNPKHYHNNENS